MQNPISIKFSNKAFEQLNALSKMRQRRTGLTHESSVTALVRHLIDFPITIEEMLTQELILQRKQEE